MSAEYVLGLKPDHKIPVELKATVAFPHARFTQLELEDTPRDESTSYRSLALSLLLPHSHQCSAALLTADVITAKMSRCGRVNDIADRSLLQSRLCQLVLRQPLTQVFDARVPMRHRRIASPYLYEPQRCHCDYWRLRLAQDPGSMP